MSEQPKQPSAQQFADEVLQVTMRIALLLNQLKQPAPGDPTADENPGFAEDVILLALYIQSDAIEMRLRRDYERNRSKGSPSAPAMISHMKTVARELRKHFQSMAAKVAPNIEGMSHEEAERIIALLLSDDDTLPRA
jgi:hypothetical protein